MRQDAQINRLNRECFRRAVEIGTDADRREWAMTMMLVSRALERIGDNAVDIGEQVAFVVTGLFREFSDASHRWPARSAAVCGEARHVTCEPGCYCGGCERRNRVARRRLFSGRDDGCPPPASHPCASAVLDSDTGFLQVLANRLDAAGWQHRVLASPVPIDALVSMRLNVLVIDLAVLGPRAGRTSSRCASGCRRSA